MHAKQNVCPHRVLNASTYVSRHIGHACASSSNDDAAPCATTVVITALCAPRAKECGRESQPKKKCASTCRSDVVTRIANRSTFVAKRLAESCFLQPLSMGRALGQIVEVDVGRLALALALAPTRCLPPSARRAS